jgi:hypothetical protein
VFEKYENRGFTVVAVNVEPAQQPSVVPLLAATGISFVAAESDWKWAETAYGVTGTPTSFLIDQQGRVMFKPDVHDAATRAALERQVEALLNRPDK